MTRREGLAFDFYMNFNLLKCIIVEMKNCFIRTMFKFMLSLFLFRLVLRRY